MTNPLSADELEKRAASQRERLHASVTELRSNVRERLDVKKMARTYLWKAAAAAGLLALALGHTIGGAFRD